MGVQAETAGWPRPVARAKELLERPRRQELPPPSQESPLVAKVDHERCSGCGNCVAVCPVDAIRLDDGKARIEVDACAGCGACVEECNDKAIRLEQGGM
jgi:ferredoxin